MTQYARNGPFFSQHIEKKMSSNNTSSTPPHQTVGSELAREVALSLDRGQRLFNQHRDYCGIGLWKNTKGEYEFSRVNDGFPDEAIVSFSGVEEFVEFLAGQSDFSMSGAEEGSVFYETSEWVRNNQRITIHHLEWLAGRE